MRNRILSALLTAGVLVTLQACAGSLQQQPPPTTAAPTSPSPTATATSVVIPSNWIHFKWAAAGLSVRLPSKPRETSALRTVRRVPILLRVALVSSAPGPIEVGIAQLGVPLTPKGVGAELQASVQRFADSSGATLVSAKAIKFRGMRARTAVLARGTQNFQLLVFQRNPSLEIFVFATEGEVFKAVTTSLKLL